MITSNLSQSSLVSGSALASAWPFGLVADAYRVLLPGWFIVRSGRSSTYWRFTDASRLANRFLRYRISHRGRASTRSTFVLSSCTFTERDISLLSARASPSIGSIFRRYVWSPSSLGMQDNCTSRRTPATSGTEISVRSTSSSAPSGFTSVSVTATFLPPRPSSLSLAET